MFDKKDEKENIIDGEDKTDIKDAPKDAPEQGPKESPEAPAEEVEEPEEITDLSQMSPVGSDPFVLISRDEKGVELNAAQIGQKGCIVAYGKGICFVPGAVIQQAGENNCLA